jgi:hypothetical protein
VPQLKQYFHEKLYCGPTGDKLYDYLIECNGKWKLGTHYTPMVVILQASGMGKSCAVRELATKGLFVMYASFANETMNLYPPRSPFAMEMTVAKSSKHYAYVYMLTHVLFFAALIVDGHVSQTAMVKDLAGEDTFFGAQLVPMFHKVLDYLSFGRQDFKVMFANTVEHYLLAYEHGLDDVFQDC